MNNTHPPPTRFKNMSMKPRSKKKKRKKTSEPGKQTFVETWFVVKFKIRQVVCGILCFIQETEKGNLKAAV